MPHHRGWLPSDVAHFSPAAVPLLRKATEELSTLLSWRYPLDSSLELVGNHHQLHGRQRLAVRRAACSVTSLAARALRLVPGDALRGQRLHVDGLNLLIGLETLLGGAVLIRGVDGCLRDIAGLHGSYHMVEETERALLTLGQYLEDAGVGEVCWLLDRPVSNSGRLAKLIEDTARHHGWPWQLELHFCPDRELIRSGEIVVSSDGVILEQCHRWTNLLASIQGGQSGSWIVDLSPESAIQEGSSPMNFPAQASGKSCQP